MILGALRKALSAIALAAMTLLVAVTAVDVIGRNLFNAPLGSAYEAVAVLLGLVVYAGLFSVAERREHVTVDLLSARFGAHPRFDRVRDRIVWMLELVFMVVIVVLMARQTGVMKSYHETFLFLPLAKWLPLAGYTMFAAFAVLATVVAWRSRRDGTPT